MIVYRDSIANFINQCNEDALKSISSIVSDDMRKNGINSFDKAQVNAWQNSLPAIADVLSYCDIDSDVDIAIEYKIRQSRDRIDFIIYGVNEDNRKNVVVIELKQWSNVSKTNKKNYVNTFGGHGQDDYWHPSYQAYNYVNLMSNFNEYIQNEDVTLSACSYLHNMDNGNSVLLDNLELFPLVKDAPVFLKDDKKKLAAFISKYVKYGDRKILYEIENSRIVPSKHLSKMLSEALKGNEFFSYDESQANAVSEIVKTVEDTLYYDEKRVIIIKGGPGTGKSVVAINVLGQLINSKEKRNVIYATANSAPRILYTDELIENDYKKNAIKNLFKHPMVLNGCGENTYDCVLVDEAHRVFDYKTGIGLKKGTHIFEQIIKGSRVVVFFIDEDQAVTYTDYVTIEKIRELAYKMRVRVSEGKSLELTTQFRVLGGEEYISFIKSFLGYNSETIKYKKDNNYDFQVFDKAADMMNAIKEKDNELKSDNQSGKCRVVAGYTYNWISKNTYRDSELFDIVLDNGDFKAKWNLRCKEVGNDYSWLNDVDSVNEVGCIHTCQGLDMNYCGVIIGKDLTYENGKITFHKERNAKTDVASGIRRMDDDIAEKLIRNTYNVLLTRGMKGTYVYCEDEALRDHLKSLIEK